MMELHKPFLPTFKHPLLSIHTSAIRSPDELGMVFQYGSYSFREASNAAFAIADYLRSQGVRNGDLVAIDLKMELDFLAKHAVFLLGAISISLHGFTNVPEGLDPDWIFTHETKHPVSDKTIFFVESTMKNDNNLSLGDFDLGFIEHNRPVLFVFTSGTTGSYKAVVITDQIISGRVESYRAALDMSLLRLGLIYNSGIGLFTQLAQISSLKPVLFAESNSEFLLPLLNKEKVESLICSPIQLLKLFEHADLKNELGKVKEFVITGALVPHPLFDAITRISPNSTIKIQLGSNETGLVSQFKRTPSAAADFVGSAVAGAQVEVVNDFGKPVPFGETGTIRIKTSYMATEYYNDMIQSAKSFRKGWFYSGDMGHLDQNGGLYLSGRDSDVINVGGVKINPNKVEALVSTLEGISVCAGVKVLDPVGSVTFALAVVGDKQIDLNRLEKLVNSYFPFNHPTVYRQLPELPKNQNGKLDRKRVSELIQETLPST